jgi:hypothetical protein
MDPRFWLRTGGNWQRKLQELVFTYWATGMDSILHSRARAGVQRLTAWLMCDIHGLRVRA